MDIASLPSLQVDPAVTPFEQMAANPNVPKKQKVEEACRQFEAVLLRQILSEARKTVIASDGKKDSNETDIYNDMVNTQMADNISRSGTFGLAQSLESQLVHQVLPKSAQEAQLAPAPAATPPKDLKHH
jgi:flagellar protein FlgJ